MSANLIGFGCDLQQKLDALPEKQRRVRWAGDVGVELYGIARELHRLYLKVANKGPIPSDKRMETRLLRRAQAVASKLADGVQVHRQPDPRGWPMYVVFPGDVSEWEGTESVAERGISVPPLP